MSELKPCPFCGKEMQKRECGSENEIYVWCRNCGAIGPNGLTLGEAERMWNMRRSEDALKARIAKLEARLRPIPVDVKRELTDAEIEELGAQEAERKEFCPNCEAETPCTHEAELFVCDICGEDFAKYIVSRNCTLPDVSTTQDVLTSIKTSNSIENTNHWISIKSGRLPEKFQECIVLDKRRHVHNWIHDDALLPLFAQYTHWMPLPELPEEVK